MRHSPPQATQHNPSPCRIRNFAFKGNTIPIKYDDTYHFYRPPRAHHCRVTNVVVDRFDHFCPWMGTTIGARNYRAFLCFLAATSVQIAVTVGFCVAHVVQHVRGPGGGGMADIIGTPAVVLVAGSARPPLGALRASACLVERATRHATALHAPV